MKTTDGQAAQVAAQLWQAAPQLRSILITGHSMLPLLRAGDRALVMPVQRPLRRGDLVVITLGAQLVVHRLIGFAQLDAARWLLTKGDNGAYDPPLTLAQVVGIVFAVQRGDVVMPLTRWHWRWAGCLIAVSTPQARLHRWLLRTLAWLLP